MVSLSVPSLAWSLDYYDAINSEILSLSGKESSGIESLAREAVSTSRKTRSILCALWCEALSGDFRAAVPLSAAYELAHVAALVEDDIIDGSRNKLGSETISAKYGIPKAMLVSNTLLFCAPPLIAKYAKAGEDPHVVARLLELLGDCGRLSARGEFLDLEMSQISDVSEGQYLDMITMKTGALVGASSASGALVGIRRVEDEIVDAAYSFGESLGIAYQIRDDLQDYFGSEIVMGKAAFCDLRSGKKSLPLIHCMKLAGKDERDFISSVLTDSSRLNQSNEERIRTLLLKYGSDDYCRETALGFVEKARGSLSVIKSDSKAKERLLEVIDYFSSTS